jgi:ADP-ribose pyrophosphatase
MSDDRKTVVAIEEAGEVPEGRAPFLTLVRKLYRNRYEDGTVSRPYAYEHIHRRGYDAVAIALYTVDGGNPWMAYRPGIRVPAYFRKGLDLCLPDRRDHLFTPEAVAGSLEPGDVGLPGFLGRVVAEVEEEAGFKVAPSQVEPLGAGFFPSHGQSSEKIHLVAVRVNPGTQFHAEGDGSVNEADAPPTVFRPVREILLDCARGLIEDPKVEILALRLCHRLKYIPQLDRDPTLPEIERVEEFRQALDDGAFDKQIKANSPQRTQRYAEERRRGTKKKILRGNS